MELKNKFNHTIIFYKAVAPTELKNKRYILRRLKQIIYFNHNLIFLLRRSIPFVTPSSQQHLLQRSIPLQSIKRLLLSITKQTAALFQKLPRPKINQTSKNKTSDISPYSLRKLFTGLTKADFIDIVAIVINATKKIQQNKKPIRYIFIPLLNAKKLVKKSPAK